MLDPRFMQGEDPRVAKERALGKGPPDNCVARNYSSKNDASNQLWFPTGSCSTLLAPLSMHLGYALAATGQTILDSDDTGVLSRAKAAYGYVKRLGVTNRPSFWDRPSRPLLHAILRALCGVFWVFWHLEIRTIDTFKHIQKNTTFWVVEFAVACFAFVLKK